MSFSNNSRNILNPDQAPVRVAKSMNPDEMDKINKKLNDKKKSPDVIILDDINLQRRTGRTEPPAKTNAEI